MGWFESSGQRSIECPAQCEGASCGDVFIHSCTGAEETVQMWIRTGDGTWEAAAAGHIHPYLPGYRLVMTKGKPGWVTRKTIATYGYRGTC